MKFISDYKTNPPTLTVLKKLNLKGKQGNLI